MRDEDPTIPFPMFPMVKEPNHPRWQEEFHIWGMVTTLEDHKLPQADIDPETYAGDDSVDPADCEACQKEYYNHPKYPVKGWDYDDEPISLASLFGDDA